MNTIDKNLMSLYKRDVIENFDDFLPISELFEELKEDVNISYVIVKILCKHFSKYKLKTVLDNAGIPFSEDFIDKNKFNHWSEIWSLSSQSEAVISMLRDKKVMAMVSKNFNRFVNKYHPTILLYKQFPENELWTDSLQFVESLDFDGNELVGFEKNIEYSDIKEVSSYIDFIKF